MLLGIAEGTPLLQVDVEAFIARLAMAAVQFLNVPAELHYERDPKDTPHINLALGISFAALGCT